MLQVRAEVCGEMETHLLQTEETYAQQAEQQRIALEERYERKFAMWQKELAARIGVTVSGDSLESGDEQDEVDTAEAKSQLLRASFESKQRQLSLELEAVKSKLGAQLAAANRELSEAVKKSAKDTALSSETIATLTAQLEESRQSLDHQVSDNQVLRAELQQSRSSLHEMKLSSDQAQAALSSQLQKARSKVDELSKRIKDTRGR